MGLKKKVRSVQQKSHQVKAVRKFTETPADTFIDDSSSVLLALIRLDNRNVLEVHFKFPYSFIISDN